MSKILFRLTLQLKNDKFGGKRKSRVCSSAFLDEFEILEISQSKYDHILVPHWFYFNHFLRYYV